MGPIISTCCNSQSSKEKPSLNKSSNAPQMTLILLSKHDISPEVNNIQDPPISSLKNIEKVSECDPTNIDIEEIVQTIKAPNKKIRWEDFTVNYLIGSGAFGEIFLGELNSNRAQGIIQRYVIKRMKKADVIKQRVTQNIRLEKKILEQSSCKFITKLYFAFKDDYYLYIVMEWAEGGDTYSLIKANSPRVKMFKNINEVGLRFILACLILGLEYLHSKQIIYRDLKPQNLLIFSDGYVKLTDFGLARKLKENQFTKTLAGTTIYYSPEMVLGQEYNRQVDLWTLGVYSYEMSNFSAPFAAADIKNKVKVKKIVQTAENHRIWKNQGLSLQLKNFINQLLKFDPQQRLGAKSWDDVKNHEFFTCVNFNWKAVEQQTMESPLKHIISQYKMGYIPYDPSKMNPSMNLPLTETSKDLMSSWSIPHLEHSSSVNYN